MSSTEPDLYQQWTRWRAERNAAFGQPYGWLSLTALHWLEEEPSALDGLPGLWWGDAAGVHYDPVGSTDVLVAGSSVEQPSVLGSSHRHPREGGDLRGLPVEQPTVLWNPDEGAAPLVSYGEIHLELILRDGFLAVRVRDPRSPSLRAYSGVPSHDYDPAWRLVGRFRPAAEETELAVGSAAARVKASARLAGEVDLEIGGVPQTLKVTGDEGGWLISFRDPGHPKFRWIVLDSAPTEELVVDFNFAANPPCAFTDFGTCPLPPAGNVIAAPVLAGERDPRP